MAVKKSRTGKKKRPEYGPQGTKTNAGPQPTEEEIQQYKTGRRANFLSLGLLVVAMILLLVGPNVDGGGAGSIVVVSLAYVLTIVAGCMMLYTTRFLLPERVRMTRICAWVMVGVGIAGLFFQLSSAGIF